MRVCIQCHHACRQKRSSGTVGSWQALLPHATAPRLTCARDVKQAPHEERGRLPGHRARAGRTRLHGARHVAVAGVVGVTEAQDREADAMEAGGRLAASPAGSKSASKQLRRRDASDATGQALRSCAMAQVSLRGAAASMHALRLHRRKGCSLSSLIVSNVSHWHRT